MRSYEKLFSVSDTKFYFKSVLRSNFQWRDWWGLGLGYSNCVQFNQSFWLASCQSLLATALVEFSGRFYTSHHFILWWSLSAHSSSHDMSSLTVRFINKWRKQKRHIVRVYLWFGERLFFAYQVWSSRRNSTCKVLSSALYDDTKYYVD